MRNIDNENQEWRHLNVIEFRRIYVKKDINAIKKLNTSPLRGAFQKGAKGYNYKINEIIKTLTNNNQA